MKYCLWHKASKRIAVNLSGVPLTNLSKDDVQFMFELMHPKVREQVEVRSIPVSN